MSLKYFSSDLSKIFGHLQKRQQEASLRIVDVMIFSLGKREIEKNIEATHQGKLKI